MTEDTHATLFHFSFAVDDLDRARRFYGELLGCPEGRKLPGRADFNFFGHHIVAHLAPGEVVGDAGRKLGVAGKTPLRHFGVVMTLEDFEKTAGKLRAHGATFLNAPEVTQKGTVREQMLMTVSDTCGNAVEFKGLRRINDVYSIEERGASPPTP
ncbi:MAG: glyoxalase [Betaproteobacteria bacterium]|nr:MAG: glyoxalase [Betaproteobacteria bacterium]RPI48797.1 MAG: glyoxalase [Betaproteobacteria bacterium]